MSKYLVDVCVLCLFFVVFGWCVGYDRVISCSCSLDFVCFYQVCRMEYTIHIISYSVYRLIIFLTLSGMEDLSTIL